MSKRARNQLLSAFTVASLQEIDLDDLNATEWKCLSFYCFLFGAIHALAELQQRAGRLRVKVDPEKPYKAAMAVAVPFLANCLELHFPRKPNS